MKSIGAKNMIKNLTIFFLGMSCVLFGVRAFTVTPIAPNAIMFIKTIFLTSSGSNTSATGIVLEGGVTGGITITNLTSAVVLGTDQNGKIISSSAANVYNYISGYAGGGGSSLWTGPAPLLTPIQINEVRFQVGSGSIASGEHAIVMGENNIVDKNSSHANIVGGQNNIIQNSDNSLVGGGSGNQIIDANI